MVKSSGSNDKTQINIQNKTMSYKRETAPEKALCTCYCFLNWIPGTGTDVIISSVVVPTWFGMVETQTDTGDYAEKANVRTKKYVCNTTTVVSESDQTALLAKNSYVQTRTRSMTIVYTWAGFIPTSATAVWGPWSPWSRTNGAPRTIKGSLTWANLIPYCFDKNIPCP